MDDLHPCISAMTRYRDLFIIQQAGERTSAAAIWLMTSVDNLLIGWGPAGTKSSLSTSSTGSPSTASRSVVSPSISYPVAAVIGHLSESGGENQVQYQQQVDIAACIT